MGQGDIEALALDLVAAIAAIDIGTFDRLSGETFGLIDLGRQGMAVVGIAGQ